MRSLSRFKGILTSLQILSAMAFGAFAYCQTRLVDALGDSSFHYTAMGITVLLFCLLLTAEILEQYVREKGFALKSAKTKADAARSFFAKGGETYSQKSEDGHISYFANEIGAVLEQSIYLRFLIQKQFFYMCTSLILLFVLSKECLLVVTLVALAFGAVVHFGSKALMEKQKTLQEKKTAFGETVGELHKGFHEIHINQMEALAESSFQTTNTAMEDAQYRYRLSALRLETVGVGQNMLIYISVLVFGSFLASIGKVGVGIFVIVAELMVQVLNEWSLIMKLYAIVRGSSILQKKLEAYIAVPADVYRPIVSGCGSTLLEAEGLSFQYGDGTEVLHDVSLSIGKGEKYLLTGKSGCGKSTLLKLLAGHQAPRKGILQFHTDKIAYIPQSPFVFRGSLKENLTLGKKISTERIEKLMKKVGLEKKLDTEITEEGSNLSGGEKARIALIRALLTEPELLLADEVTANLDEDLGKQVEHILINEYPDMALCMVSHRAYCGGQYDGEFEIRNHGIVRKQNETVIS